LITLRPYQEEALDVIMADLVQDPNVLLQAATGGGKTIIFAEIIRRWMNQFPRMEIMIAAHRRELITQARDKLLAVWPEGYWHLGLACAGVGPVRLDRAVTIGSVQTLNNRQFSRTVDLLIIDEAHRLPALETGGQYHSLIRDLRTANPRLRVLGVTATPFRLGHGYIYGPECRPGRSNLFPMLNYQISLDTLVAGGFLVPWRAKEGRNMANDLARVKIVNGEYDVAGLNSLYLRGVHIQSAVEAYDNYGEGRDKVLVFAVSIEHAERLAEAFNQNGHQAAALHSHLADRDRTKYLTAFEHGGLKVLVNVGILTEGWDSPKVNLIMMCRPTKAPALFVQMLGRGTRLHPGKADLLVLDLANNFKSHGDPSSPQVQIPANAGGGDPPFKSCPTCQSLLAVSRLTCPDCGHKWEVQLEEKWTKAMVEVKAPPPGRSRVVNFSVYGQLSFKNNFMLVLDLVCRPGGSVKKWLDIEGVASIYGRGKARSLWHRLTGGTKPPDTVREAESRAEELKMPEYLTVIKDSHGYKSIKEFS
jgi:DNA repair protein RadD